MFLRMYNSMWKSYSSARHGSEFFVFEGFKFYSACIIKVIALEAKFCIIEEMKFNRYYCL